MTVILFWAIVALIVYTYVGFPALVWIRGWLWARPYRSADVTPQVSMIVVAHNEAASIAAKLQNLLSLDYPREKLEILVASDGSSDATNDIVRSYRSQGIRLLALPRNGKIAALNAVVAEATGEILVFSDANSMFAPDAVRLLVRPLADERVGGVAGDQRYLDEDRGVNSGERAYWSFDRRLKRAQSAAGSVTSATGAIYAIRRALFRTCPPSVTDDFTTSTGVIAAGYRLVFVAEAAAYEPVAASSGLEFGRKVRVITRGLNGVLNRRELLNPLRHGFYALQLFSHKVLRRLIVIPILLLFVLSLLLVGQGSAYPAIALLQLGFYGCASLGMLLEGTRLGRLKLFALPLYFCMVNTASLIAAWNVMRGHRIDIWQPQRDPADQTDPAEQTAAERPELASVPVEGNG